MPRPEGSPYTYTYTYTSTHCVELMGDYYPDPWYTALDLLLQT